MAIQSLSNSLPIANLTNSENQVKPTSYEAQQKFGAYLKDALNSVNTQQIQSDTLTQKLVMGENVDLHEVMVAAQKASISLNATMEMRNKVIEAYQEIIRMPV
ncbi:flagellar hook-basal body complex protein FliE [Sporosarcina sp. CAU 1771]